MKKYKLTEETKISEWTGKKITRIEAIIDFGSVKAGAKGGFVEDERNLDIENTSGDAWVYGDAEVYGNARVFGNAKVYGNAKVFGDAWVSGDKVLYRE